MKTMMMTILLISSASMATAQDDQLRARDYQPRFTYDFRYPDVMSRESLTDTSLMLADGIDRITQYGVDQIGADKDKGGLRQRINTAALFCLFPLATLIEGSEHEEGHLQAFSRVGIKPNHFAFFNSSMHEYPVRNQMKMIWTVFLHGELGLGISPTATGLTYDGSFGLEDGLRLYEHLDKITVMFSGGGLNQTQYTSERLADRVLEGRAAILDFPMWFCSLTNAMLYTHNPADPGNDMHAYPVALKAIGIDSNESHMRSAQWPRLFSGSSLSMTYGLWRFFRYSETEITPLPAVLPEFASYLTLHGPTFKVRVPVRFDCGNMPMMLEPSIQSAIDDPGHNEFGLRGKIRLFNLATVSVGGFTNTANGTWLEAGAMLTPCRWFEIGVDADRGRGSTFQREIIGKSFSFMEKNEWSLKLVAAVNIRF